MKQTLDNAFTSTVFWDRFWNSISIPVQYNPEFNNDRAIAEVILRFAPNVGDFSKRAIEIGCAPGKWMLFLLQKLKYTVHGCEYLGSGVQKTRQNFEYFQISLEKYQLFQGDFFNLEFDGYYDLALSLGFVEHFENFAGVMEKHLALLKSGGILIIGLPRFVGVNWLIQAIIDQFTEERSRRYLPAHNLRIMNLRVFKEFAAASGCELLFNEFVGGFEGALFPLYNVRWHRLRDLLGGWLSAFTKWKFLQTAWYGASYQMCVMRKR